MSDKSRRTEPSTPSIHRMDKNCQACAHCYMEPDDLNFVCGHPDSGTMGLYVHRAAARDGHCGVTREKFKQHPLRNSDGTLKAST